MVDLSVAQGLIRLGRATERLHELMKLEIFETLSKHDPEWESEHEKEADKLDEARRTLSMLQDNLWDIYGLMTGSEDHEY